MIYVIATAALLVALGCAIARVSLGPTVFDRVLSLNSAGTKTVLFVAVVGFLLGRPEWLDLALVYALVNYLGTLAVLRFAQFGSLANGDPVD